VSQIAVARRYAAALAELAEEQRALDPVAKDLAGFSALLDRHAALRSALGSPAFTRDERRNVVDALLKRASFHALTGNFLRLLVDKNRMAALPEILEAFSQRYDERRGRVRAEVSSAVPLDAATLAALQRQIQRVSGKNEVLIRTTVDPSLIGGIVTRVGDRVFDGSIRTQLRSLKSQLLGQAPGEA